MINMVIIAKSGKIGFKILINEAVKDLLISIGILIVSVIAFNNIDSLPVEVFEYIPRVLIITFLSSLIISTIDVILKGLSQFIPENEFKWFFERIYNFIKEKLLKIKKDVEQ